MVLLGIVIAIVSAVTGIQIWAWSYIGLLFFALIFGFGGSFISLYISKWIAKKTYSIAIWEEEALPTMTAKEKLVWDTVKRLSSENAINMPEVGLYMDSEPNAFATGRNKNNSLVAVSSGLLDVMTEDEVEWVIGHEMAHILNWDMVTMALIQGVLNTFVIFLSRVIANIVDSQLSDGESSWPSFVYYIVAFILDIIFGFFASLIAMWFSRYREFRADADSAFYVGKPKMIAGLQRLKLMQDAMHTTPKEQMASFKIGSKKRLALFSTHPALDDRIKALKELELN